MRRLLPVVLPALIAGAALTLTACGSTDASREAASASGLPDCTQGFAQECVATVGEDTQPIAVANGALVAFSDQGQPVTSIAAARICWSPEEDLDASTCATSDADIPAWMSVQRTVVNQGGTAWPGLRLRVFEVTDSSGEDFVPLPATISVNVEGASGPGTVNLEVACCDRVAESAAAAVEGSSAKYITLTNKLVLADGTPAAVTWQVSNTQNKFWDGSSRPDKAPPQGLQGLVQSSGSDAYKVRTEVADQGLFAKDNPNFTLTPVIEVGGKQIPLAPWLLVYLGDEWQMTLDNQTVFGCRTTPAFTTPTPQGDLQYTITGKCGNPLSSFTIDSVTR